MCGLEVPKVTYAARCSHDDPLSTYQHRHMNTHTQCMYTHMYSWHRLDINRVPQHWYMYINWLPANFSSNTMYAHPCLHYQCHSTTSIRIWNIVLTNTHTRCTKHACTHVPVEPVPRDTRTIHTVCVLGIVPATCIIVRIYVERVQQLMIGG